VNIRLDTTDDLWKTVTALGKAAGKEAAAEAAISRAKGELSEIADLLKHRKRPKVVYVTARSPLGVVGSDNFMDEMLTLAGGDNVARRVGRSFMQISNETLIQLAPDVLLIGAPGQPEQTADDPRLESWMMYPIPAVANNRVWLVTDGDALTASVNLPKSIRGLSKLIYKWEPMPAAAGAATQGEATP
jgi:iron complex transport system substrate-binding protein